MKQIHQYLLLHFNDVESFIIYDVNLDKLKMRKFLNKDTTHEVIIFPICIRQKYFSHMVICWIKNGILFYYNSTNIIYEKIISKIIKQFSCKFVQIKECHLAIKLEKELNCTLKCLKVLELYTQPHTPCASVSPNALHGSWVETTL